MDLDPARFQQTIDELTGGIGEARAHVAAVPAAANTALQVVVPGPVAEVILWCAEQIVELATGLLDLVEQALAGATAPLWFLDYLARWQDVRSAAGGVASGLAPELMPAAHAWSGPAADAYTGAAVPQRAAAAQIAAIAEKTSYALGIAAGAGIAFYVFLGIIVVKLIAALVAALIAFGSAVFSPAGAALVIEEAAVDTGLVLTAAGTLATALAAQASQLGVLYGEAVDQLAYPGGHWPNPVTTGYTDATVTDGDADWSLRR